MNYLQNLATKEIKRGGTGRPGCKKFVIKGFIGQSLFNKILLKYNETYYKGKYIKFAEKRSGNGGTTYTTGTYNKAVGSITCDIFVVVFLNGQVNWRGNDGCLYRFADPAHCTFNTETDEVLCVSKGLKLPPKCEIWQQA